MSINPGQQPRQGLEAPAGAQSQACWLWFEPRGFDEGFEVLQGMASHEIIIDTDFLACHGREVHHAHRRAFPAEMFGESARQGLADTRQGHDIAIKDQAYLTALRAT